MLSFPIAPPSATHTGSRNPNSIPDLMLLQERGPPAPPQSLCLLLPSPVPGGAIQPWLSRASPETHTHGMFTVPKPQIYKHKPHPDLGHTTQIKRRMQHVGLFSFSNVPPHGITTPQGEELIQQLVTMTQYPKTVQKTFHSCCPKLIALELTPGTQDLPLPLWL